MTVSFIIPAYNASATIRRCLDSVFSLPYSESEYEVIVIDDCSTDQTVDIVSYYCSRYHNITVLEQPENHRQGAARNRGLSLAKGEYVVFLDSDDELAAGLTVALAFAERKNLEMVASKAVTLSTNGEVLYDFHLPFNEETIFTGEDLQTNHPFWCTAPWGYVFKRSFLESVNYPFFEDVLYEDSDFVYIHLYRASRMGYSNALGYIQHENLVSTTHTISYKSVCDYALLGVRLLSFYEKIDDKDSTFAYTILEGGSWNIMRSCKRLFKLESYKEILLFYDRFDSITNRDALLRYDKPSYCWTSWTRFCLRHKNLTTFAVGAMLSTGISHILKKFL